MESADHGVSGMVPTSDASPENINSTGPRTQATPVGTGELEVTEAPLQMIIMPRYRECQRNYAANIGGHAVDGCGEFLPAGVDGTLDALRCAACNCHRNFHRKETYPAAAAAANQPQHHHQRGPSGYLHLLAPRHLQPVVLPTPSIPEGSKKRVRTKFTPEQKEKMKEMAERLGWRMQRHNDAMVEQFCNQYGVTKQVFKIWMHNNKSKS